MVVSQPPISAVTVRRVFLFHSSSADYASRPSSIVRKDAFFGSPAITHAVPELIETHNIRLKVGSSGVHAPHSFCSVPGGMIEPYATGLATYLRFLLRTHRLASVGILRVLRALPLLLLVPAYSSGMTQSWCSYPSQLNRCNMLFGNKRRTFVGTRFCP